jgi:hypothetical protein
MFTTGSKWFLSTGVVALVLAAAYGWTTGGNGLGPVTAGYKGGVGDHLGYALLLGIAATSLFFGFVALGVRDAETAALAEVVGLDTAPAVAPPARRAYWPTIAAFGAATLLLGLVISNVLFVVSLILLGAAMVEWMVLAWSDRATGDAATNKVVRDRLLGGLEVPLAGVLLVGGTILAFSRLLLTSSEHGAVIVAAVLGAIILLTGVVIATRPKVSPNVIAGVLAVAAVGIVVVGVASASRGERYVEPHEEHDTGNVAPVAPGTNYATTTTAAGDEG